MAKLSGDKILLTFRANSRILESRIEDEDEVFKATVYLKAYHF